MGVQRYLPRHYSFLKKLNSKGLTWAEMAEKFNEKFPKDFSTPRTGDAIRRAMSVVPGFKKSEPSNRNPSQYSQKHVDFLVDKLKKGLQWVQIVDRFNAEFSEELGPRTMAGLQNLFKRSPEAQKKLEQYRQTRTGLGDIVGSAEVRRKTFIITAATPVRSERQVITHRGMMKAIETYMEAENAELVILPMRGHARPLQSQPNTYDQVIMEYRSKFRTDFTINGKISVIDAELNPQQVQPLTGMHHLTTGASGYLFKDEQESGELGRYVKNRRQSIIVAHPKQAMTTLPTGKSTLPRQIWSTGSCTIPDYLNNRIGRISHSLHTLGGVIVDIIGDYFLIRPFQCNRQTGEFVDQGYRYHADGTVEEERALVAKIGDRHTGETNEIFLKATYEQAQYLQPLEVFWEDYFTGGSINHHEDRNIHKKALRSECFRSLAQEAKLNRHEIARDVAAFLPDTKHIMNYSNHGVFLHRYLEEGRYFKDPVNFQLATELHCLYLRGIDPLQALIDSGLKEPIEALFQEMNSKMTWLDGESEYWVEGVNQGEHGHVGIKGSRGSKFTHYLTYEKANVGHTHSPFIFNGIYGSGALTDPKQSYSTKQPIMNLPTNIYQYEGGHRQLVTTIGSVWKK